MIKKLVLPLSAAIILMLLLPFLFSRGWKATLSESVQRELPGNVLFTDTKEDFSHIAVKVLHADTNIVEDIPIYDYLCGVVAAEMSPEFELEALKAQTVAACSYMVYRMEGELSKPGLIEEHHGAYVCTDYRHCKAYLSKEDAKINWGDTYFNINYAKIETAVNSVLGEIITYDGKPANAVFHSISSGKTESAEDVWGLAVPYLVSVESYADTSAETYESVVQIEKDEFLQKVSSLGDAQADEDAPDTWIGDTVRTEAGGVKNIELCGATLTGEQVRTLFSLRSSNFDIAYADGAFTFTVRGYGHGVGMSQYGANELAKKGMDYKEILKTYYTGVEIVAYDFSKLGL